MRATWLAGAGALMLCLPFAGAAQESPEQWTARCRESGSRRSERHCEVREYTLRSTGNLRVSSAPNGGIQVIAWDRPDVQVIARIQAQAPSGDQAKEIVSGIEISAVPGDIRSTGPEMRDRRSWSVSYQIRAPARTSVDLNTVNGGLDIEGLTGQLRLQTVNGSIRMAAVAGAVRAETTNGPIHVALAGGGWEGEGGGLDVETTNGSVRLTVPEGFGARLEASTTNGGLEFGFPVTVEGRMSRRVTATIGGGGPMLRIRTTNGAISVIRAEG